MCDEITVVGAGKTGHDIERIRECQRRGKIIAVDRIHPVLKEAGITPDYTISGDPNPVVSEFLRLVDEKDRVILSVSQARETLESVVEKTQHAWGYIGISPWSWVSKEIREIYGEAYSGIIEGRTVGTAATELAVLLGAKHIRTIGLECGWLDLRDVEEMYIDHVRPERNLKGMLVWTINPFWYGAGNIKHMLIVFSKHFKTLKSFTDLSGGLLDGVNLKHKLA
jgi:hypothetical protein